MDVAADLSLSFSVNHFFLTVDGEKQESYFIHPETTTPFPVIVFLHPFIESADFDPVIGFSSYWTKFVLEGLGVFIPIQRGFLQSEGSEDYGGPKTVAAIQNAIQNLLLTQKNVDTKHIFIHGASRGAHVTAQLLTQMTDVFTAAAVESGSYDTQLRYLTTQRDEIRDRITKATNLDPHQIELRSPIKFMDKLGCPLLIIHGGHDDKVAVQEAINLDKRLTELGKKHQLLIYPDADHYLVPHKREKNQQILTYFSGFLRKS